MSSQLCLVPCVEGTACAGAWMWHGCFLGVLLAQCWVLEHVQAWAAWALCSPWC